MSLFHVETFFAWLETILTRIRQHIVLLKIISAFPPSLPPSLPPFLPSSLSSSLPFALPLLPSLQLGHLKRVRKDPDSSSLLLLLSTPARYHALNPSLRLALEQDLDLHVEVREVPRRPCKTRHEQEIATGLWPLTYQGIEEVVEKEKAALDR